MLPVVGRRTGPGKPAGAQQEDGGDGRAEGVECYINCYFGCPFCTKFGLASIGFYTVK